MKAVKLGLNLILLGVFAVLPFLIFGNPYHTFLLVNYGAVSREVILEGCKVERDEDDQGHGGYSELCGYSFTVAGQKYSGASSDFTEGAENEITYLPGSPNIHRPTSQLPTSPFNLSLQLISQIGLICLCVWFSISNGIALFRTAPEVPKSKEDEERLRSLFDRMGPHH